MAIPLITQNLTEPNPLEGAKKFNADSYQFHKDLAIVLTQMNAAITAINRIYNQDVIVVPDDSLTLVADNEGSWNQFVVDGSKFVGISEDYSMQGSDFSLWIIENASTTGNITFNLDGVDLIPPAGGTNAIPPKGVACVKRTGNNIFKLFGQVVAI